MPYSKREQTIGGSRADRNKTADESFLEILSPAVLLSEKRMKPLYEAMTGWQAAYSLKSGAVAVSKISVTFFSGALVARVPIIAATRPAANPGTSS